jgi:hypothetical protein
MKSLAVFSVLAFVSSPALADIRVDFIEGAPKDRFVVSNLGKCDLGASKVTIDLAGSAGRLIFDVTNQGEGVEVFQPFELVSGEDVLSGLPLVRDGDKAVELDIVNLKSGGEISFTIDVDDTIGAREITVTNSEIEGAKLIYQAGGKTISGKFNKTAKATVKTPSCAS